MPGTVVGEGANEEGRRPNGDGPVNAAADAGLQNPERKRHQINEKPFETYAVIVPHSGTKTPAQRQRDTPETHARCSSGTEERTVDRDGNRRREVSVRRTLKHGPPNPIAHYAHIALFGHAKHSTQGNDEGSSAATG